jgi:hypothetical protein
MSKHWGMMSHKLPVLVLRQVLVDKWVLVDLSLHIDHIVGHFLEKLQQGLQELLHRWIHLCLLRCTARIVASPLTVH